MTDEDFRARFAFGTELAREAGALALDYFQRLGTLTIKSKGPQDMVSEADVEVETMIRARIAQAFPEDAFMGEETGRTAFEPGGGIWVVDPIDGTQPFVSGMTSWCVSIAYLREGRVQMGFVFAPARGEMFVGGLRQPAMLNGEAISVRHVDSVREGLLSVGYSTRVGARDFLPSFDRFLTAGGMFHREGSGALALCYVAAGRLIGYMETHINSWDCLGALAVIEAAGGVTNDFLAGEGLWQGNSLVAGSPELYPALAALFFGDQASSASSQSR